MILSKTTLSAAFLAAGLFLFNGCAKSTQPETSFDAKDGTAALVASEVSDMGVSALSSTGLSKEFSATPETLQITRILDPWHFDVSSKAYVRHVVVTYPRGTRERVDSVYFIGSAGDTLGSINLAHPLLADISNIYHIRHVIRDYTLLEATLDLAMNIAITKADGDTAMVKNGTIVRSRDIRNLDQDWNCRVTNVKRERLNGVWQFPSEGSIHIEKTTTNSRNGNTFNRTLDITFTGDSTADVTATRSWDGKKGYMKLDFKGSVEGAESDR